MKIKIVSFLLLLIIGFGFALRIYKINNTSLFGDELDFGYQALSIVQTGKDYYGHTLPIYFQSLSEWKTGAFIYTLSPFVAVFGINDLGIRLPSIIFGTLTLLFIFLLTKEFTKNNFIALTSAFFLAITPWHLHYSRIGFEASEMFFTYIAGTYFLYKARTNHKLLLLSAFLFAVSFVIYRTQLVFVPLSLSLMLLGFRKELLSIPKKYILFSITIFLVICLPYTYQSFFGPGSQRFSTISIFDSKQMDYEVGIARSEDLKYAKLGPLTKISSEIFHNKYTYYSSLIASNFYKSFSTEFLFVSGDPDPRQSPGVGELYMYMFPFLLIGILFFVDEKISKRNRAFVLSWLIVAPLAASLTRDGANHATRLFMLLLPFSLIFSYGVFFIYSKLKIKLYQRIFGVGLAIVSLISLVNFLHLYIVHYPAASEVWWQSSFKDAIRSVVSERGNFDKIIISSADEPAEIFFLAWSSYPPKDFQKNLFAKKFDLKGFGQVAELNNYLFTDVGYGKDIYTLAKDLPANYLYLATAKETGLNLVAEPQRVPNDLKLIKTITYPSGKPVYYLFSKK